LPKYIVFDTSHFNYLTITDAESAGISMLTINKRCVEKLKYFSCNKKYQKVFKVSKKAVYLNIVQRFLNR